MYGIKIFSNPNYFFNNYMHLCSDQKTILHKCDNLFLANKRIIHSTDKTKTILHIIIIYWKFWEKNHSCDHDWIILLTFRMCIGAVTSLVRDRGGTPYRPRGHTIETEGAHHVFAKQTKNDKNITFIF